MIAKKVSSDRRRSRPVTKPSPKEKIKRNKPAMALVILIVLMLIFSGSYVIFTSIFKDKGNPIAIIDTSMGTITLELYEDKAPITVDNFITHAKNGYYDGLTFHRVKPEFMIQGGDPKGDGTGGRAAEYHEGYGNKDNPDTWVIPDEFHPDLSNIRGSISMANRGKNTGSSQFFINVENNTYLYYDKDPLENQHAVFGMVTDGMTVADNISNVETDENLKPLNDVVINSIKIENE